MRLLPCAAAALVLCSLLPGEGRAGPGVSSAADAPDAPAPPDALEARAEALRQRLRGHGFTILTEGPFVIVGDESPARVRRRAETTLRWAIGRLEQDYFGARPARPIEIWLFRDEASYRRGAKRWFGDEPDTPYGYYSTDDDAIVMNVGPGAGTLVHEIVHPYVEANLPGAPAWFNEGLASLYERPIERDGHIAGLPNWRLRNLRREVRAGTLPSIPTLLATSSEAFYDAAYDSYAFARYLLLYLQDRGLLLDFYRAWTADRGRDPTGVAALRGVLGLADDAALAGFQRRWQRWVLTLTE